MYLGDYVQESVHGKVHVTSTYGHNYAKDAITLFSKNTIITEHVKILPSVLLWVVELAVLPIKLSYKVYL